MSNIINIPNRPENPDVQAQAREWVIALDGERPSPAVLAELRAWVNRSPLHRQALEQAAAAWNSLDSLAKVLDQLPAGSASAAEGNASRSASSWWSPARAAFTTVAVLLVAVLAYRFLPDVLHPKVETTRYATAVGEMKTLRLPDGSEVKLNTNSAVRVSFPGKARILQLEGEAYFTVAPDAQRPFVVYAGRYSVRALGTAFAVHALESGVDLTVTDGHVELASFREPPVDVATSGVASTDRAETRVALLKGQHAHFDGDTKLIQTMDAQALEQRLSWRDGVLIFDNDPLSDIVAELNRYTNARIVISEPDLKELRLGGYFKVQDIGSILETLRGYGLRVERINDNLIYLSRMN